MSNVIFEVLHSGFLQMDSNDCNVGPNECALIQLPTFKQVSYSKAGSWAITCPGSKEGQFVAIADLFSRIFELFWSRYRYFSRSFMNHCILSLAGER